MPKDTEILRQIPLGCTFLVLLIPDMYLSLGKDFKYLSLVFSSSLYINVFEYLGVKSKISGNYSQISLIETQVTQF